MARILGMECSFLVIMQVWDMEETQIFLVDHINFRRSGNMLFCYINMKVNFVRIVSVTNIETDLIKDA